MRIAAYIITIALTAGLLAGLGVYGAWRQQQMLRNYQPVKASVELNETRSSKLGGFEPDLRFSYTVKGKTYESGRAAPLRINGSRSWVDSVTRRILAEGSTAYYNPQDPGEAYLLPIGRFRPYGLILVGLALFGLGIFPIRAGGVFAHEPLAITGGPFDWYCLTPGGSYADRVMGWSAVTVCWYLLGAVVVGHYYMTTPPSYELKSGVLAALYVVAGLWPASRAVSAAGVASRIGEPKAHMTQKIAHLGEPIIVRIEQPFLRDTTVREVRVALTCTRRNGLGSVRYYISSNTVAEDRAVHAGEVIHGEFTFEVPQKKRHPSTPFNRWNYPRTDWQIEVTASTGSSAVTVAFPIRAENVKQAAKAA
jgi:Protein of unknown function (DUF3592)